MYSQENLHLYEEVMLLALQDKEGKPSMGSYYQYAVGGALLAELLETSRIRLEGDSNHVILVDAAPFEDVLLDECLQAVQKNKKQRDATYWVSEFAAIKELKHKAARGLCQRGILRCDEKKVLLVFSRKLYPEVDHGPELEIIGRLREALFAGEIAGMDPRTARLIALAGAADLLKMVFDRGELKGVKKKIKQIADSDRIGKAAREAMEAAQAAAIAAATSAAIT